jgi:hypothetical protein
MKKPNYRYEKLSDYIADIDSYQHGGEYKERMQRAGYYLHCPMSYVKGETEKAYKMLARKLEYSEKKTNIVYLPKSITQVVVNDCFHDGEKNYILIPVWFREQLLTKGLEII